MIYPTIFIFSLLGYSQAAFTVSGSNGLVRIANDGSEYKIAIIGGHECIINRQGVVDIGEMSTDEFICSLNTTLIYGDSAEEFCNSYRANATGGLMFKARDRDRPMGLIDGWLKYWAGVLKYLSFNN